MLFGPQSLGLSVSGTTMGQAPVGKKWNIKQLTPGLLAFASISVIVLLVGLPCTDDAISAYIHSFT